MYTTFGKVVTGCTFTWHGIEWVKVSEVTASAITAEGPRYTFLPDDESVFVGM
jgi:hypothetical protein